MSAEATLTAQVSAMKIEELEPQVAEEHIGQTNKTQQKWKAINSFELCEPENTDSPAVQPESEAMFTIFRYLGPSAAIPKY